MLRSSPQPPFRAGLGVHATAETGDARALYARLPTPRHDLAVNSLRTATGEVIGRCYKKHRALEFRKFLAGIDKAMSPDVEVHLVLDNYSTHTTALIRKRLLRHPRYHFHFTLTKSSWINQVERWFAEITRQQIQLGIRRSIRDAEAAIKEYIASYNENPKPFIWTKSADEILESLESYCTRISGAGH